MLVTDDADRAARARRLREHGMSVSAAERHAARGPVLEQYLETGFNYRMTDIQAAVGLVQLAKLDAIVARRRELGERYRRLLAERAGPRGAVTAGDPAGRHHQLPVVLAVPARRASRSAATTCWPRLADAGVSARRGHHGRPPRARLRRRRPGAALPVTERLTRDSLILPLFHEMTEADQDRVVERRWRPRPGPAVMAIDRPGAGCRRSASSSPATTTPSSCPRCVRQRARPARTSTCGCSSSTTARPTTRPPWPPRLAAADPRVEVRRHPVNRGHIATYNEGLAWADGDYVALVSADDMRDPRRVRPGHHDHGQRPAAWAWSTAGRSTPRPTSRCPRPTGRWRGTTVWDGQRWIGQRCRTGLQLHLVARGGRAHLGPPRRRRLRARRCPTRATSRCGCASPPCPTSPTSGGCRRRSTGCTRAACCAARYADPLVDLRHRKAAFDSFFAAVRRRPSPTSGPPRPRRPGTRPARRCGRRAGPSTATALDEVDVAALVAFADEASPDARRLPEWHGLRRAARARRRPLAVVPAAAASPGRPTGPATRSATCAGSSEGSDRVGGGHGTRAVRRGRARTRADPARQGGPRAGVEHRQHRRRAGSASWWSGVVLARLIVPEQFGVFAAALVVLNVVVSISELGVSVAIVRARDQAEVDRIAPVVTSVSVLSGAGARCADGADGAVAGAGPRRPGRHRPDPRARRCRCSSPGCRPRRRPASSASSARTASSSPTWRRSPSAPRSRSTMASAGYGAWSLAWSRVAGSVVLVGVHVRARRPSATGRPGTRRWPARCCASACRWRAPASSCSR